MIHRVETLTNHGKRLTTAIDNGLFPPGGAVGGVYQHRVYEPRYQISQFLAAAAPL